MIERNDGLFALHGNALAAELTTKFSLVDEAVVIESDTGPRVFTLRKPPNADLLISEEDFVRDERLPYWADLWPSARVLATTLLNTDGHGRTLIELGCGLGLPSLAAQVAGYYVTATDYYEDALHVARLNGFLATGREPNVCAVDWRALPEALGTFDVVVGADLLYERGYGTLVAATIGQLLAPGGEAWIADPGRTGLDAFLEQAAVHGLRVTARDEFPYDEEPRIKQTIRRFHLVRDDQA